MRAKFHQLGSTAECFVFSWTKGSTIGFSIPNKDPSHRAYTYSERREIVGDILPRPKHPLIAFAASTHTSSPASHYYGEPTYTFLLHALPNHSRSSHSSYYSHYFHSPGTTLGLHCADCADVVFQPPKSEFNTVRLEQVRTHCFSRQAHGATLGHI